MFKTHKMLPRGKNNRVEKEITTGCRFYDVDLIESVGKMDIIVDRKSSSSRKS